MKFLTIFNVFILVWANSSSAQTTASVPASETESQATVDVFTVDQSSIRVENQTPWVAWKLTEEEWRRYQEIMQTTPRGVYSPDINPVQALGVSARSDAERTRYASLQAELRLRREYEEFIWEAYVAKANESDQILQLNEQLSREFEAFLATLEPVNTDSNPDWVNVPEDLYFFLDISCTQECSGLMRSISLRNGVSHIFLAGALDDSGVRGWANTMGIPVDLVQRGVITLNHSADVLTQLGYSNPSYPLILSLNDSEQGVFEYAVD